MKRFFMMAFGMAFVAVSTAVVMPSKSEAIPAFARQVGVACSSCHYQHFPKLSAFGRAFKLGGMTDVGAEDLVEDEGLSIPAVLNAAYVVKTRYQKTSAVAPLAAGTIAGGTDRGQLQMPDEAAILMGGRAGEHWGGLVEFSGATGGAGMLSYKMVYSVPVSFGKAGLSIYTTDGLGAAYGMELFNTAVVRNNRGMEHGPEAYAADTLGFGTAATGLALFAGGDLFFANVSLFGPASPSASGANTPLDIGTALSTYYRLAFTPQVAGFDTEIGFYGTSGTTKLAAVGATATTNVKTSIWGIDAQAQGSVAGMALELTAGYSSASGKNLPVGTTSAYAGGVPAKAWSLQGELSVLHNLGIQAAYSSLDADSATGAKTKTGDYTAFTLGAFWELTQNIELMPQYTWYTGNGTTGTDGRPQKTKFTLLFETAF